jgi:hypothetical protein
VFEHGDGLGFALEAGTELGVVGEGLGQHFDGDVAIEVGIVGFVDGGHAAAPEFASDFVTADFLHGGYSIMGG